MQPAERRAERPHRRPERARRSEVHARAQAGGAARGGIDGKNAEVREATLRLKLFNEHTELLGLEVTLNEAKRDLEHARLGWDCLRYKLRLLEVQKVMEGAA